MFYGVNDSDVAAAAAEMRRRALRGEGCFDLRVGGVGIFFQELGSDHHHATLAEAAKRSLFLDPGLLHGMKDIFGDLGGEAFPFCPTRRETFERGDFRIADGGEWRDAGADLFAVQQDGTRAALRETTAKLWAR